MLVLVIDLTLSFMPPRVAIIILNYGTYQMTIDLVRSLLNDESSFSFDLNITIVDNLSLDDSHQKLEKFVQENQSGRCELKFLQSGKNGGFSFGINVGLKANQSADYFFLLNSDANLDIRSVESMIRCARSHADDVIVSPKIVDEDQRVLPSRFGRIGAASEFLRTAQTSLLERIFSKYKLVKADPSEPFGWVSFAAALIPSKLLNDVGLLDEGFFMYFEDAEYCSRAIEKGFGLAYDDQAVVLHKRGGSSDLRKDEIELRRLPKFYYESRSRYLVKRGGVLNLILTNLSWYLGSLISFSKRLLGGNSSGQNSMAWLDIWKGIFTSRLVGEEMVAVPLLKPNFLIVGAMKSATSTLYEQLRLQPEVYLPQEKEPNFFGDDKNYSRGLRWYSDLYETADTGSILGEASTDYAKYPLFPNSAVRIKSYAPACKIIYMVRHPIDRLVSHYVHEWTQGNVSDKIDDAVLRDSSLIDVSLYEQQLSRYLEYFEHSRVYVLFFERFVQCPEEELRALSSFLGAKNNFEWKDSLSVANKSSERIRRFPGYGVFIESELATFLRRGLVPEMLRQKVKSSLRMSDRPRLTESSQQYLRSVFDPELTRLGQLLNMELNLDNYHEVAKETQGMSVPVKRKRT